MWRNIWTIFFTSWWYDDVAEEDVAEHAEDEDDGVESEEHPSAKEKNRILKVGL